MYLEKDEGEEQSYLEISRLIVRDLSSKVAQVFGKAQNTELAISDLEEP